MHIERDNINNIQGKELVNVIKVADDLSEQINKRENDCLNSIYTRFCLLKGLWVDFRHVKRKSYPGRPNYWEYWYKIDTPKQYFLMSREFKLENNVPKLNITFSKELTKNNEL